MIDEHGQIIGWRHRIVAEAVTGYSSPARLDGAKGLDPLTLEGATHQYAIPNQSIEYLRHVSRTPLQAWRSIGAGYNKFAIECFIDEIAHEQGVDPVELRLKLLEDQPGEAATGRPGLRLCLWPGRRLLCRGRRRDIRRRGNRRHPCA
jgi:isoquinoline 1-oxidoreductase subunit beta